MSPKRPATSAPLTGLASATDQDNLKKLRGLNPSLLAKVAVAKQRKDELAPEAAAAKRRAITVSKLEEVFNQVYFYFRNRAKKTEPVGAFCFKLAAQTRPRVSAEEYEYRLGILCEVVPEFCALVFDELAKQRLIKVNPVTGAGVDALRLVCRRAANSVPASQ